MIWIDGTLVSRGEAGVYGERVVRGHRVWDPYRSKLAAYYYLGGDVGLEPSMRVLYLGAAHGTTVSHVSDYVEVVYAVENAYTPMRDLLAVALRRKNIIPLFADAAKPASYTPLVEEVDLLSRTSRSSTKRLSLGKTLHSSREAGLHSSLSRPAVSM